jgi:hypothetical protein
VAHDWRTSTGSKQEVRAMAKGRDRPRKQPKRKAKEKAPKLPPTSSYEPPASVEVIKPRRKEREQPRDEE